jgi:hypothetical protein
VTDELETDVSRLQHHCDDMVGQVTQLTQGIGKKPLKSILKINKNLS